MHLDRQGSHPTNESMVERRETPELNTRGHQRRITLLFTLGWQNMLWIDASLPVKGVPFHLKN
jgi:hypothetical protein